jgi:hypothetical protein
MGRMKPDATTADKTGQFWARPAIGVVLNIGGMVVAKMRRVSQTLMKSGNRERLLDSIYQRKGIAHGSW